MWGFFSNKITALFSPVCHLPSLLIVNVHMFFFFVVFFFYFPSEKFIQVYSTSPTTHMDNEGFQDRHWAAGRKKETGKRDKDQARIESPIADFM